MTQEPTGIFNLLLKEMDQHIDDLDDLLLLMEENNGKAVQQAECAFRVRLLRVNEMVWVLKEYLSAAGEIPQKSEVGKGSDLV